MTIFAIKRHLTLVAALLLVAGGATADLATSVLVHTLFDEQRRDERQPPVVTDGFEQVGYLTCIVHNETGCDVSTGIFDRDYQPWLTWMRVKVGQHAVFLGLQANDRQMLLYYGLPNGEKAGNESR